jgi:hypothetical protein
MSADASRLDRKEMSSTLPMRFTMRRRLFSSLARLASVHSPLM